VHVRHGSLIDNLQFYYGRYYSVGGGGRGGGYDSYHFAKLPSGCVDRVNVRSGSFVDGIRFLGGSKQSQWFGGRGGSLHTIRAPSHHCLGDVQMRTGSLVDQICFKFNA